jgi:hypothetical protein
MWRLSDSILSFVVGGKDYFLPTGGIILAAKDAFMG